MDSMIEVCEMEWWGCGESAWMASFEGHSKLGKKVRCSGGCMTQLPQSARCDSPPLYWTLT